MTAAAERAEELLVDCVTEGLEPQRQRQLDRLLAQCPDLDRESFELAAAAIELACTRAEEPLPAALRDRLARQARKVWAEGSVEGAKVMPFPSRPAEAKADARMPGEPTRWLGWLAAAAALALAVAGWWPGTETGSDPMAPIAQRSDPAAARSVLVAQAPDLIALDWTATEDPAAADARGDVVWSTALQHGYMRFQGLPVNDPTVEQYQLWIFDVDQDERYPVDGGVFDVAAAGETVVEIAAKLEIVRPTLFAVTIEKPGGVVVSSRERLPLLAQVG